MITPDRCKIYEKADEKKDARKDVSIASYLNISLVLQRKYGKCKHYKTGENRQNRVHYECLAMLFLQAKDGDFTWNYPVSVCERDITPRPLRSALPLIPTTSSTTITTIIIIIIIIIWQAKPRWSVVKRQLLARRSHQQPLTPSLTLPRLWQQVATPDTMVTTTTTQKLGIPLCSLDSMSSLPMQLQVAI
ncbi:hypothetical protein TURU_031124 [Turdus rufiventris]|nr:hypothetical protein TURU_031124 [Turdus rufiventris]